LDYPGYWRKDAHAHAQGTPLPPVRIELLDLLSQGERSVDALAVASGTPLKSTSAHLRALRLARLVETRREGTHVYYALAGDGVFRFLRALQQLGRERLAEVEQAAHALLAARDGLEPVTTAELRRLLREGKVTLLDVRPREEFEAAHIPGARSMPLPEVKARLAEIPKSKEVIAYCRGPYCVFALDAVGLLRKRGYRARRLETGLPDWRALGHPVAGGSLSQTTPTSPASRRVPARR
jgi:rhodanese-related sulfurtransferase/DNA-binding transcriptional ArsR family regulator